MRISVTRAVAITLLFAGIASAQTIDPSWVVLYPGDNIQNQVNLFPAGTTFYLKAGTYGRQQVTPKSGDTFIGQPGAIMDGQNVTAYAFYSNNKGQSNVTIKSLEIKNYTTPNADYGAITGQNVTKWIVTDNVVHHNKQAGIRADRHGVAGVAE